MLNWPRLIQENKRFSQLAPVACGLPAENYDGVLAQHLVDSNWTVHHVTKKCLYDHSPSPQVNALSTIKRHVSVEKIHSRNAHIVLRLDHPFRKLQ